MTNNKKSFLLHIDSLDILDDLTNGQAGVLFKAIKAHQNGEPLDLDSVVKMAFLPFKNQFKRDDEKYKTTCERRALAGSKGGKQRVANQAIASKSKQTLANQADNKNKKKNKTNSDNDNKQPNADRFDDFWNLYDKKKERPKCEAKFAKLKESEVNSIFEKLPLYIQSTPDKTYRKDPIRYLNGKCWDDEVQGSLSIQQQITPPKAFTQ